MVSMLDLERFRTTPLTREPFEFLIVPEFVKTEACAAIDKDYPEVARAGSFPLREVTYGPAFAKLIEEMRSEAFRRSNNSWHGHRPFSGPRRVIQFNWVTSEAVVRREQNRHRFSAWMKKMRGALSGEKQAA